MAAATERTTLARNLGVSVAETGDGARPPSLRPPAVAQLPMLARGSTLRAPSRGDRTTDPERERASFGRAPLPTRPIGYHLTFRLADDRPITTCPGQLRVLARVMLDKGERCGLLAFGAADNHLHALVAADRETAGAFAHAVETALHWRLALGVPFERARIRPLADHRHMVNTFHYVQRQDGHHGLGRDPAREGTSLPDLLGLRVYPATLIARVRAHLPRLRRDALITHFPSGVLDGDGGAPLAVLAEAASAARLPAVTSPGSAGR